jgi:hypothetical protein
MAMMSALAERWQDEQRPEKARRTYSAALRPVEQCVEAGRSADDGQRWNVLAEEVVAFPSRSQQIWLEHGDTLAGRGGDEHGDSDTFASRQYADAWLAKELETLRRRRARALTVLGDPSTTRRGSESLPRTSSQPPARLPLGSRAIATSSPAGVAKSGQRGLRRVLPGAATLAVLAASWFGVGALGKSSHPARIHEVPGSVRVAGGFAYVVKPGDTLWSIASRAEPGADPRPLVDRLQAELHGQELQPGDRLLIPG